MVLAKLAVHQHLLLDAVDILVAHEHVRVVALVLTVEQHLVLLMLLSIHWILGRGLSKLAVALAGKREPFVVLMLARLILLKGHHLVGLGGTLADGSIVHRKVLVALLLACATR